MTTKEIEAILSRLHSGSRFISYTDAKRNSSNNKTAGTKTNGSQDQTHNTLRNQSQPDEIHCGLGEALAVSYVRLLNDVLATADNGAADNGEQTAIEAGQTILNSLVCQEEEQTCNRGSYASVASSFFCHLIALLWGNTGSDQDDLISGDDFLLDTRRAFVTRQWMQWCIYIEELVHAPHGNGGYPILYSCLKGYASIILNHATSTNTTANNSGAMYTMLKQSYSRKQWIRLVTINTVKVVTPAISSLPFKEQLVECLSSEGMEVVSASTAGIVVVVGVGVDAPIYRLFVDKISPLVHVVLLQARLHSSSFDTTTTMERQLLLYEVLRACAVVLRDKEENVTNQMIAHVVRYLSISLVSYLGQIIHCPSSSHSSGSSNNNHAESISELAYEWLRGLCDTIQLINSKSDWDKDVVTVDLLSASFDTLLRILPHFSTSNSNTTDMYSIYSALYRIVVGLPRHTLQKYIDATLAIRLGSLALSLHDNDEIDMLCKILSQVFGSKEYGHDTSVKTMYVPSDVTTQGHHTLVTVRPAKVASSGAPLSSVLMMWIGGILCSIGNVFSARSTAAVCAVELKRLGESLLMNAGTISREEKIDNDSSSHLINILSQSLKEVSEYGYLVSIMTSSLANVNDQSVLLYNWKRRPLSLSEQYAALLIGLSHLRIMLLSSYDYAATTDPFALLSSLLAIHPRMSARVVPSIVYTARICISNGSTEVLLKAIKFLSSSAIVSDPHGASIAWTFLSSLVGDNIPASVRSSVLRILPGMCAGNKKLRSRIRVIIGKSLASKDPIVRTAAMASLSDLAKMDLLRDIEEIVVWIQVGLNDEEVAVSYFALLSLKYLVSNDELDFDLVIRVLVKRLGIDLDDMGNLLEILGDGLVLEGFVMLLAEAGFEEEEEEKEENEGGPIVSAQSMKAVTLLINLALSPGSSFNISVKMSILKSLAGFNSQLLGLDAEVLRSWDVSGADDEAINAKKRYEDIKHITLTSLDLLTVSEPLAESEHDSLVKEAIQSITSIMVTLLRFEEETHGSSLFRGAILERAKDKEKGDSRRVAKTALASLPDYDTILRMYEDDPNASTSTALMCSISDGNLSTESMISQLSDLFADFVSERFTDPHMQAIHIMALVDGMRSLKRSIDREPEQQELFRMAISEIQSWVSSGEEAYVALALFAVGVGTDLQPEMADEATSIQNSILQGFDTLMFDSEEVKLLCLCLVASKLSHSADSRVADIIDRLEKYFTSLVDGQVPFGVMFGMSVLVNHLVQDGNLTRSDPSDAWRRKQARRVISLFLSSLNNCLTLSSPTVSSLEACALSERSATDLKEECAQFDEPFVKDRALHTLKSLMIGLGQSFQAIAALDAELSGCILSIIDKLPWKSGKTFALPAAYKSCIEAGVRDQNDLSNEISLVSSRLEYSVDDPSLGHMVFAIANLSQLRSRAEMMEAETEAVKNIIQAIMDPGREVSGDRRQLAILSAMSLIGEVRGLSFLSPGLHTHTKKDLVASTAEFLKVVALNDSEDTKTREAAMVSLGLMCGMKASDKKVKKSVEKSMNDRSVNFNEILQGKEDTLMLSILIRINASHSIITTAAYGDATRTSASKKLSVLLQSLEAVALPGSVSRVIEVTLNDCNKEELELKTSCIKLLTSQLVSRRRVGFDGRGFVDLYTRISKMSPEALHKLVGSSNVPLMMAAISDLIPQLPTSSGEDALTNLWTTCQYDLASAFRAQSAIEYFVGLKTLLVSVGSSAKKNVVSPAILRCIQKLLTSTFFQDMCQYAGPSPKSYEATSDAEKLWIAYAECVNEISDSSTVSEYEVINDNLFGLSVCSPVLKQSMVLRKVELYIISRLEWLGTGSESENHTIRMALTSLVAFGHQFSIISELKVSILSLFDLMLVKGIDTLSLEVLAVQVAFWWSSLQMDQLDILDSPVLQAPTETSLLLTRNLCFKMQAWSLDMIVKFISMCIRDLPPKLAFVCQMTKISDDVANKALRVLSAATAAADDVGDESTNVRRKHAMTCLRMVVQLMRGGEQ